MNYESIISSITGIGMFLISLILLYLTIIKNIERFKIFACYIIRFLPELPEEYFMRVSVKNIGETSIQIS